MSARSRSSSLKKVIVLYQDSETQTVLHAQPHILQDDQVASVSADAAIQTNPVRKGMLK